MRTSLNHFVSFVASEMGSERINAVFEKKRTEQKPAFVTFVTAGHPTLDSTVDVLLALQEGGADIIELGVPFSDPTADGPVIQAASVVALQNGVTTDKCLQYVRDARSRGLTVPVIFMGYYNPFIAYGEEKLMQQCKESGVDGFIVVDLPPEESEHFRKHVQFHGLSFIPLAAPVTSNARLDYINSVADSMVYCVSLLGVTGGRTELPASLPEFINRVKDHVDKPLAVGFGISTREHFLQVSNLGVEAIVVGSTIVKALNTAKDNKYADAARDIVKYFLTPSPSEAASVYKPSPLVKRNVTAVDSPLYTLPANFGKFGGRFASETLMGALDELEIAYAKLREDPVFQDQVKSFYSFVGRPTPLYYCERLSKHLGGARIWLKREDLAHTGAHKINNAIGQAIIAKRLGKSRIIAETGAGQHGVATATVCAKLGLECIVYMGKEDVHRQSLNVFRMKMLGAKVVPVESGSQTLKDAINEAMRDWVANVTTTHYMIGSAIGPHPFPTIVRDFQSVIGKEARSQFLQLNGKLPDAVMACVGGGSNAIGMFHPFVEDKDVKIIGVEAAGESLDGKKHCATLSKGTMGVLHGTRTLLLQDNDGQIAETHSVSAGLDYPGVGPELAHLKDSGRAEYVGVTDQQALEGFQLLTKMEGIIPALETSHAIYYASLEAKKMKPDQDLLICLSGRGDKDMMTVAKELNITL